MDQFRIIYRILRILDRAMDDEEFDRDRISAEALGITDARWRRLMRMLVKHGYVEGVRIIEYDQDDLPMVKFTGTPSITMEGLQYLEENSMMHKAMEMAKNIRGVLP